MGTNQRSAIVLTDEEIEQFLEGSRSMTLATVGADGTPHLVAMWFAVIDGDICFETKAKSQKAVNLRRNPKVSCLVEDGVTYEELRGVAIEGTAEVIDDPDLLWRIGVNVWERYYAPVHRRPEAVRRDDAQQAGRRPGQVRADAVVGPPQARDALDRRRPQDRR